jgi:drug/metabolite transporter (DMT)-like permease
MQFRNKKTLPLISFIILSLIWSSTWVVLKVGLYSLPPFLAAGIRFSMAFIILYFYARLKGVQLPDTLRSHLFLVLFGALNFTGGYAFVYWGQQYIASGLGSVLFSVMPFYVLIFSIWLLPEDKINFIKFAGVLLGFSGVVIIFWDQLQINELHNRAMWGMLAVVTAPIFSTFGTILGKKARKHYDPIALVTFPMLYASIVFYILSIIFEQESSVLFDFYAVFSLFYLSILGTAVAFAIYFWMLKSNSAVMMSMITFVTPPLALVWGWILLDEPVTYLLVVGLVSILAGIFLVRK